MSAKPETVLSILAFFDDRGEAGAMTCAKKEAAPSEGAALKICDRRERYTTSESVANAALLAHVGSLASYERDQLLANRWNEVQHLAAQLGVTDDEVRSALDATKPRQSCDRFHWHEAMTACHAIGLRTLRVANAMFSFAGPDGYLWPSQRALARRAGYSEKDAREVRRSIAELIALGAVRKLKVGNLPRHHARKALGNAHDGGSNRTYRGSAYALVPPDEWQAPRGAADPSSYRGSQPPYNHQVEPSRASRGIPPHPGIKSFNVEAASTYQNTVKEGDA